MRVPCRQGMLVNLQLRLVALPDALFARQDATDLTPTVQDRAIRGADSGATAYIDELKMFPIHIRSLN